MSLIATHIRFALDTKNKYQIQDIGEYLSGAIYPDSRYVTGIDRSLTHNEDFLLPGFASDDFHQGWQTHIICDMAFDRAKREIFTELDFGLDHSDDDWINSSAIKILSDIADLKKINDNDLRECLNLRCCPNGENADLLEKFFSLNRELYFLHRDFDLDGYATGWQKLGVPSEMVAKFIKRAAVLRGKKDCGSKLEKIYHRMLEIS